MKKILDILVPVLAIVLIILFYAVIIDISNRALTVEKSIFVIAVLIINFSLYRLNKKIKKNDQ
ncbi:MAG: hypothetical protein HY840_07330 [Bacteroidetes bacterium]|nr:hypothetical protein [Bacteroidota bacterium]